MVPEWKAGDANITKHTETNLISSKQQKYNKNCKFPCLPIKKHINLHHIHIFWIANQRNAYIYGLLKYRKSSAWLNNSNVYLHKEEYLKRIKRPILFRNKYHHQNWEKKENFFSIGKVPIFGLYYIRKKALYPHTIIWEQLPYTDSIAANQPAYQLILIWEQLPYADSIALKQRSYISTLFRELHCSLRCKIG